MGPNGPLGKLTEALGVGLLTFTFSGACNRQRRIFDAVCCAAAAGAFESIGKRPLEVAATLRAAPWDTFLQCNSTTSEAWLP